MGLPKLGITTVRAKIDTGARTSALHAVDIETFVKDDVQLVSFQVPSATQPKHARCTYPVLDQREIKNTSGIKEKRIIIKTTLVFGERHWQVELSLADRENMGFDLILGRTAIRDHNLVVHPGRSFLMGQPKQILAPLSLSE